MENVRKNEQQKLSAQFRKYFKRSRSLLMKRPEKLTPEDMDALALMFEIAPRLADAYRLKNEFLTVIRSGSSAIGRERLKIRYNKLRKLNMAKKQTRLAGLW